MVRSGFLLVFVVEAIVLCNAQTFTIPCSGCTCFDRDGNHVIDCSGRRLTTVPDGVRNQGNVYEINLSGNLLTHMRYADFTGTTADHINLSDNNITTIDDGTFDANPTLLSLDLHQNNLYNLPEALTHLVKINSLDVRNNPTDFRANPIQLTDHVMKEMGDTIQTFQFGHRDLDRWPNTIDHFQDLQDLTLDGSSDNLKVIPAQAFHSFQSTLLKLTIKNTKLVAVPLGVSTLRRIDEFHFDNNLDVGNEGVVAQAFFRTHGTLRTLSLINDNLTRFPRALAYIPTLRNLDMSHNRLEFISDESIANMHITNLTMHYCNLDRIPGALFHLQSLTALDMSHNNMITVENNDIENIPNVDNLTLAYNPIKFISNTAFGNHKHLGSVDISFTNLTTIPEAFNTTTVGKISMEGSQVDCMCRYVWVRSVVNHFDGCCINIEESIEDYIQYYVPLCPEYIELNGPQPTADYSLLQHFKNPEPHCQDH
ncbi:leucine-rich repeat-containing protein 40-like [Argopecten irradians]|uniref:Leucine rich repeat only protein 8 n=1 Tax=Argopecten irradians TaxID=31199 RepID=A0A2R3SK20_ARGIR|nr:leucine rich repeat only protein 8 [Argopecten irradians]